MKKFALIAIAALIAGSAFAAAGWVGNSYINFNGNWYYGSAGDDAMGPGQDASWGGVVKGSFTGSLGTFEASDLTSITLGGQFQAADNGQDWGSGAGENWITYSIDNGAEQNIGAAYKDYGFGEYSNNMRFEGSKDGIDLSGLSEGDHTISFNFAIPSDNQSDGGNPFTASFTIASAQAVPEPATMSLLGLGALALALRRKLRK
jgi:hypothetical protein